MAADQGIVSTSRLLRHVDCRGQFWQTTSMSTSTGKMIRHVDIDFEKTRKYHVDYVDCPPPSQTQILDEAFTVSDRIRRSADEALELATNP